MSQSEFVVERDGERVEDCFVLKPEDDTAARAALKTYARATESDDLAEDLRDQFDLERTPRERWKAHNESFSYQPPELPGELWSEDQYQELCDRFITLKRQWFCQKCTGNGPFRSLDKARKHVESRHGSQLLEKHETPREELDERSELSEV